MKRLRYHLASWAGFSESEAKGFIIIIILILFFLLAPFLMPLLYTNQPTDYSATDKGKLDSLLVLFRNENKTYPNSENNNYQTGKTYQLFAFDPNLASRADLLSLGIPEKLASSILNYRNKGGKFRKKRDLLKIYYFPQAIYDRLHDSIALPDSIYRKQFPKRPETPKPVAFEINTTDTTTLKLLNLIGSGKAKSIIHLRNQLGGFYRLEQLNEVWGLDSAERAEVLKFASLDTNHLKRININLATEEELKRHPYMPRKWPALIVRYRTQHGPYQNVEQLLMLKAFKTSDYLKIKPYLSVGD